jgi:succinoglycan biosynthesis transport protein ExoP
MMSNRSDLVLSSAFAPGGVPMTPVRSEITIQELWEVLRRRRSLVLKIFLVVIAVGALMFAVSTRLYKGTAEIQVQKESADALGLDSMISSPPEAESDAVEANITLQTQAQILQSDSLALQVIRELQLESSPDFHPMFNPISWVLDLVAPSGRPDRPNVPLEQAPRRRTRAIKIFESHLTVKPVAGTRLIDIEYLSRDPETAAAVVNHLVHDLTDYNFQIRHDATNEAGIWLSSQLSNLRKQSEELQAKVAQLQRDSGVLSLGQTDSQGREQVYSPALDQMQQAMAQLTQAQSARIMKGAINEVAKNGDPELISSLAGGSMLNGASAGVTSSLTLLQGLRTQEAQTQAQINELSAKFGPGYPKLTEIQASLEGTQRAIREEAARVSARAGNDYRVAQKLEDKDRAIYANAKNKAEVLNGKAVRYLIVGQEATQSRNLYESLLSRLKEADVVAGLRSTNITLVDPARPPAKPAKPNTLLYAGGSIVGGLFLAVCGALFRDATDNRIQEVGALGTLSPEMQIGLLPYHKSRQVLKQPSDPSNRLLLPLQTVKSPDSIVAASEPRAPYTEALRALCTRLMQGDHETQPPQVILVTSSVPGEGKSMLSANLAIVYAQRRKRVLLVDGDLRTPVLHERLNLDARKGLSSLLTSDQTLSGKSEPTVPLEELPGLHVLPAGPLCSHPAELLASDEMAAAVRKWREDYDYVIIDGAPMLPVTDSALLSRLADFTIVVARHGVTDRRSLERTCDVLRAQRVRQMGLLLNGVNVSRGDFYSYYGYKQGANYGNQTHA